MKHHFVYQTTNLNNGKIYIGKHYGPIIGKYLGSGKALKSAITKHGRHRFFRVILSIHDSHEEALSAERERVTSEFVARRETYNLKRGGEGGASFGNTNAAGNKGREVSPEHRAALSAALKGKPAARSALARKGQKRSLESRAKMSAVQKGKKRGPYKKKNK